MRTGGERRSVAGIFAKPVNKLQPRAFVLFSPLHTFSYCKLTQHTSHSARCCRPSAKNNMSTPDSQAGEEQDDDLKDLIGFLRDPRPEASFISCSHSVRIPSL